MKVTVEIEEKDGWFPAYGPAMPQDGDYCIVINRYGDKTPMIGQWIEKERFWVDMSEVFFYNSMDNLFDLESSCIYPMAAYIWKPLGLPPEMDAQLKETVRKWFEENGERE